MWEELRPDFDLSTREENGLALERKGEYKVGNPVGENPAAYLVTEWGRNSLRSFHGERWMNGSTSQLEIYFLQ